METEAKTQPPARPLTAEDRERLNRLHIVARTLGFGSLSGLARELTRRGRPVTPNHLRGCVLNRSRPGRELEAAIRALLSPEDLAYIAGTTNALAPRSGK